MASHVRSMVPNCRVQVDEGHPEQIDELLIDKSMHGVSSMHPVRVLMRLVVLEGYYNYLKSYCKVQSRNGSQHK